MPRKIIFISFIILCLAGGIYWFFYTKEARAPVSEGINAIPADAAIIFESKQSQNTWKKLSQTNIMWEALLGTKTIGELNQQARYIDSLIKLDPAVSVLPEDHSVFISIHPGTGCNFRYLFVYSLPNKTYQSGIGEFLEKVNGKKEILYTPFNDQKIGTITATGKLPLHFSFVEGILLMSTDEALVGQSIRQLQSGTSVAADKNFSKVLATAGKKVDANMYVCYKNFPSLLSCFTAPPYKKEVAGISAFAGYSGWDVTVKPNALMLSGFTSAEDSLHSSYLSIFARQKPQTIELTKILPQRTALMIFNGISNTATFREDYLSFLKDDAAAVRYQKFVQQVSLTAHTDIEQAMTGWLDNEMALVITEPSSADLSNNTYAVMHTGNIDAALHTLNALADSAAAAKKTTPDTSSFRGKSICHLDIPRLIPALFGTTFSSLKDTYYTSIGDYVIFGTSAAALQSYIAEIANNHILANDKNYISFAENISAEANLYVYSSISRSADVYKGFLTNELSADIGRQLELFHKFEAAGIQFSTNNRLFYSNIYLRYNPIYKQETATLWETRLDSTVSSKPFLLINHNTKAKEVLVQDDGNKLYLISNTGTVIWTKQLQEKIMSDVVQVDVLKNNKLQMVFNTRSFIYMFDRNGNDMKGFPLKLKSPATNALSVVDYENNREYRMFIACENGMLLCFNAAGESVNGFEAARTSDPVYLPVQYFNAANKDHLCAIDVKGNVYILDRHGAVRVKVKEQIAPGIRNFYIESGKDYSKTYIVAADTLGNTVRLSLSGDKEKIRFQDFETSPYFDYRDINNDKTREYIFLTRTELKVFNADKSLLFNYEFKAPVNQTPQFFLFPDGSGRIGVACESLNELYLFNENGSLYNSFPLKGKTLFSIGDLNNEGSFNLVTGSADNSIYVYQL